MKLSIGIQNGWKHYPRLHASPGAAYFAFDANGCVVGADPLGFAFLGGCSTKISAVESMYREDPAALVDTITYKLRRTYPEFEQRVAAVRIRESPVLVKVRGSQRGDTLATVCSAHVGPLVSLVRLLDTSGF